MNLIVLLASSGFHWKIEKIGRKPKNPLLGVATNVRVTLCLEKRPAVSHDFNSINNSIEAYLETMLRLYFEDHEVYRRWREERGEIPAILNLPHCEADTVGVPVHVGLRKLTDSAQSVITWNAIHALTPEDRSLLWSTISSALTEAIASWEKPTRRNIAEFVQNKVVAALAAAPLSDSRGKPLRTPAEEFALRMLHIGCRMTEVSEWIGGWLGYLWQDAATPAVPKNADGKAGAPRKHSTARKAATRKLPPARSSARNRNQGLNPKRRKLGSR